MYLFFLRYDTAYHSLSKQKKTSFKTGENLKVDGNTYAEMDVFNIMAISLLTITFIY